MAIIEIMPIGVVVSDRKAPEDDGWDNVRSWIMMDAKRFSPDCVAGLTAFSHIEIIFHMHRASPERIETGARRPRNNPAWPSVGVFAQRNKNRPNRMGATICRLRSIEWPNIHVSGLDAIDGTPVIDIKPWAQEFGPRGRVRQPTWFSELMADYW